MKYILIIILFCTQQICAQSKIYDFELNTLDSTTISLKNYKGNKILVAIGDPRYLQKIGINFLDSIQDAHPSLQMIVIPIQDTASNKTDEDLTAIRDNRSKRSVVLAPSLVNNKTNESQNNLVKFLIDVKENTHFNNELTTDFTLYVVNELGTLYGALSGPFSMKLLNDVLREKEIKR